MAAFTYEDTRAATKALMFVFAEEYEEHDEEPHHPTSPFDRDGEDWNDFWAAYAETME